MSREIIDENLKHVAQLKAEWPEGPWTHEPDREDFRAHGLPCFVQRNHFGNWCGYVGVPPGHPMHGKSDEDAGMDVHGGVTYAAACVGHLCHVPEPGEPDAVWWFGFDCGHYNDITPAHIQFYERAASRAPAADREEVMRLHGSYKDLAYVRAQTDGLAAQLAAMKPETAP